MAKKRKHIAGFMQVKQAIAVDYDCTISRNPQAFAKEIPQLALILNLTPIIATNRSGSEADKALLEPLRQWFADIIYCGNSYKYPVCKAAGWDVQIVIDDQPQAWGSQPIWLVKLIGGWKWFKNLFTPSKNTV